jgi:hypothetical protein
MQIATQLPEPLNGVEERVIFQRLDDRLELLVLLLEVFDGDSPCLGLALVDVFVGASVAGSDTF